MEVINKIPEDYVYDTETDEFEVYRHKYTGKEIHITKEPKLYKLEAQPCEDCISREAVIDHICEDKECYKEECKGRTLKRCIDLQWVFDLPPVTPQRPKGKWIDIRVIKAFHYDGEPRVRCSRCENKEEWSSNYCSNCGAEMSGGVEYEETNN